MFRWISGILEHINKCKGIKIYLWGGGGIKTIMGGFPYLIGRCALGRNSKFEQKKHMRNNAL